MSETRDEKDKKKRKKKVITVLVVLVVIAALAVVGFYKYKEFTTKTTQLGFKDIGELATQEAFCTEVNSTKEARKLFGASIPFTQSEYVYSYDIVIKAGYDFSAIDVAADKENKIVRVKLPDVKILSKELKLDSLKVYHESESVFTPVTLSENNEALTEMEDQAEADSIANGLYDNAKKNAELILTGFIKQVYSDYTIVFED